MNPQFVHRLRVVLMSTDDVWRTQFQSALDAFARDTEALEQTRQFLEEHVKGAELAYRARMEEMMGLVDGSLASRSKTSARRRDEAPHAPRNAPPQTRMTCPFSPALSGVAKKVMASATSTG